MSIEIIEMLIPTSNKFTRPGTKRVPQSITIHETDNTNERANASAHARLQFNGNRRQASWHLQVDDEKQVYLSVPYDEVAYAAGDRSGPGNSYSIHIEICVNKDGNYKVAVGNAIKIVKHLLAKYPTIKQVDVVQHNKWSGKNCPRHLRAGDWGINWNDFLTGVKITKEVIVEKETDYTTTNINFNIGDKVRVKKTAKNYATGQPIAPFVKGSIYKVAGKGSNRMRLSDINSWVKTSDLELIEDKPTISKPKTPAKTTYTGSSIVDYLVSIKVDSSIGNRRKLANQYGIKGYTGTAAQNTLLLNAMRKGAAPTPAPVKPKPITLKVGSKVKIKTTAKNYARVKNVPIPAKYKNKSLTIEQIGSDDVLIKELVSWVRKTDVQ